MFFFVFFFVRFVFFVGNRWF